MTRAEILKELKKKSDHKILVHANDASLEGIEIREKLLKVLHDEITSIPLNNDVDQYKYIYKIFKYLGCPCSIDEKEYILEKLSECNELCEKRIKRARGSKRNKLNVKVVQKIQDIIAVTMLDLDFYDIENNKSQVSFDLLMYLIFEIKNYNYLFEIIRTYPDKIDAHNKDGKYLLEELIDIYLIEVIKDENQGLVIYLEKVIKLFIDNPKLKLEQKQIDKINEHLNKYSKEINSFAISQEHKNKIIFFINEVMNYIDKNVYTQDDIYILVADTFDAINLDKLELNDKNLVIYYFKYVTKVISDNKYSSDIINKLNAFAIEFDKTKIKKKDIANINHFNNVLVKYLNNLNIQYCLTEYLDYKYDIDANVTPEMIDEINKISLDDGEEVVDCRSKYTITIDGKTTKVFDDAISLESFSDGSFLLGIYLADVASHVKQNSLVDIRALELGETIYLPSRNITMLPEDLTNILTLKESNDRRAVGHFFLFDKDMKLISFRVHKCLINVDQNFNHADVNSLLTDSRSLAEIRILKNMLDVSNRISKLDISDGYRELKNLKRKLLEEDICFDSLSSNMISNFMIYLNGYIASFFARHPEIPFIYRNNLINFSEDVIKRIQEMTKDDYNYRDAVAYLNAVCPPSFYSTVNQGHKGLKIDAYCNATNPLRDYCSLEIQRMVERYIMQKDMTVTEEDIKRAKDLSEYLNSRKLLNREFINESFELRSKIKQLTK